jgi:two-component system, chemotaxis family, CheB/CheR fusion protein
MATQTNTEFEDLLLFVKENRGFDFTGYKRPSLTRRFERRLQAVGATDYAAYRHRLEEDPDEFAELFNTILINVTSFFRDPPAWDHLAKEIVPRVVEARGEHTDIRVWSPGCASGEEAYTVGVLLLELLGEQEFRERVKIYATDVDEEALAQGRHATYAAKALADVPAELLDRYFDQYDGRYAVRKNLRRGVIFGRHDVIHDPPISRIDLLVCRNTLMYFDARTQDRIVGNFHFSLNEDGYLFLGKSEALVSRSSLFVPINLKHRVFAPASESRSRNHLREHFTNGRLGMPVSVNGDFGDAGLHQAPVAQVVIDSRGALVRANLQARRMFGLGHGDLGKPLHELEISYRPLELRARLDEVHAERRPVTVRDVEWANDTETRVLEIVVSPLVAADGTDLGATVTFQDVTRYRRLQDETEHARKEMEAAYEELQSAVEELETTNEELQSTNEELETTNEELQSTNEELETMNEEMQSTNEELETINDEIRTRTDQLNETNALLAAIVTSLGAGIIVIDDDFNIEVWNEAAAELWGVRPDEAEGSHLMNLELGLPLEQLHKPLRAALTGERSELEIPAINRRGKAIACAVSVLPLQAPGAEPRGAILLMEAR